MYQVNLSATTAGGDPVEATGTITVDKLGNLSPADLVDWSLTLTSPNNPPLLLTPANSQVQFTGTLFLNATTDQLLLNNPPPDGEIPPGSGSFAFVLLPSGPPVIQYDYNIDTDTTTLTLQNGTDTGTSNVTPPLPVVVGTAESVAAVPAPPGLALAASGVPLLAGWALRRRKKPASAPVG
jgi:hypothetical protein